jgi:hypothetical protein
VTIAFEDAHTAIRGQRRKLLSRITDKIAHDD